MDEGNIVPIAFAVVIGIVVGLNYYFTFRTRAEMQQTVRAALDRGLELSAELIDRIGEPRISPFRDLRRGIIAIAIAAGFAVFGIVLDEDDAVRPMLAISTLPLAIGIAYLIIWRIDPGRNGN